MVSHRSCSLGSSGEFPAVWYLWEAFLQSILHRSLLRDGSTGGKQRTLLSVVYSSPGQTSKGYRTYGMHKPLGLNIPFRDKACNTLAEAVVGITPLMTEDGAVVQILGESWKWVRLRKVEQLVNITFYGETLHCRIPVMTAFSKKSLRHFPIEW